MPKILKIITNPSPILREKSKRVNIADIKSSEMSSFIGDMTETMIKKDGVGLAAPQVAKNIRLVVINTKEGTIAMFNPEITKRSFSKCTEEEGCLSVPNTFGEVKRNKKINCIYQDEKGNKTKIRAEGMFARIIQHEIDHLDAILFIDKAKNIHKIKEKE